MSQKRSNFGNALQETLGNRILAALTQHEISQLLDAAFATLPSEELEPILTQLPVNTQKTLQKILNQQQNINQEQPVSLDKLAQTWSQLWQEWNEITKEASQEDGRYITQEVDWEPPYFDAYTMVEDKAELGEEYNLLRLLTKDLIEIGNQLTNLYLRFYRVVIHPQTLSSPDDKSRQTYLQQYAPSDLWERVLTYWQEQLHKFIPQPELAQKSDYTQHAQWMIALKELNLNNYETLLQQWKIDHRRRSNLWKAMREAGLELL